MPKPQLVSARTVGVVLADGCQRDGSPGSKELP